jgi:hypothetical protein
VTWRMNCISGQFGADVSVGYSSQGSFFRGVLCKISVDAFEMVDGWSI